MQEPDNLEEFEETRPLDESRVEVTLEDEDKDMFDDAFEVDEEKEEARKKMKAKIAEKKAKSKSKKNVEETEDEGEKEKKEPEDEEDREEKPEDDEEEDDEENDDEEEEDDNKEDEENGDEKEEEPEKEIKTPKKQKIRLLVGKNGERKEIEIGDDEERDEEEIEDLPDSKDEIKKTILTKAKKSAGIKEKEEDIKKLNNLLSIDQTLKPELKLLTDEKEGIAFIGRKKSIFQQYGDQASLFVGKVVDESMKDTEVYLDSMNPHVVFVCGARGSGKSYVLGVIAEELALQNKDVGIVVVDPIGVFWSMKHPNKEAKEIKLLEEWDLEPQGLDCLKVFIPEGVKNDIPKSTYDATFSLQPGLLTTDDWCLTFGIDRFSTSGLLMEKALTKIKSGYKTISGKYVKANRDYSIEELINCFETDAEINSRKRGYKTDSIRALVSRFDASQNWGIFSKHGTPLSEISRAGQLAIIDTSFLDESVGALVIGIIARRLLAARKICTRHEAAEKFQSDMDSLLELDVPPTWLFIDEAHTLIPSGNVKTAATTALVEYVKQGRRPGCSLVFATQQPSAIDTKVLSQLDIIMTHKLVFDDDIKAVYKRTPTIIPTKYKRGNFIKTLPVGTALTGDRREETSRAFVMKIRPRMSQHEGRDAETVQSVIKMDDQKVIDMAIEMTYSKLSERPFKTNKIDQVVRSLNAKHDADISLSDVLDGLEERGVIIDPKTEILRLPDTVYPGEEEVEREEIKDEEFEDEEYDEKDEKDLEDEADDDSEIIEKETTEIKVFKRLVEKQDALRTFGKMRKKKFLGLFGDEEKLESIALKYIPIYKVRYNYFDSKNVYSIGQAYINSYTGEFLHFKNKLFESKGLQDISNLNESEIKMILLLSKSKKPFSELTKKSEFDESKSKRILESLVAQGFAGTITEKEKSYFWSKKELDLPLNPLHPLLTSLGNVPLHNAESIALEPERFGKDKIPDILQKLWKRIVIKDVKRVYLPVYEGTFKFKDGRGRVVLIEALKGMEVR